MTDNTLTIIGYFATAIISVFGTLMLFRGSLAQMAKNAFDLAQQATADNVQLKAQVKMMGDVLAGKLKLTAEFNMADLLKDGSAPINGIIEVVKEAA